MPQPLFVYMGALFLSYVLSCTDGCILAFRFCFGFVIRCYADLYSVAYVALFVICARNVKVVSNRRFMIILF